MGTKSQACRTFQVGMGHVPSTDVDRADPYDDDDACLSSTAATCSGVAVAARVP